MDWNAQIGRELRELDGIVVMLLAFAGLAARAADAPYPVRCAVFWFLRQADAVAAGFVAGSTGAARAKWLLARHGSNPVGETDLAASLSSLSRAVATLATQLRRLAFLHCSRISDGRSLGTLQGIRAAFGMVPQVGRPDTS